MTGLTPGRSVLAGGAILVTCACGTATATAKLMGTSGAVGTSVVHPAMLGVGAALMLYGLWRVSAQMAYVAAAGFGVLALAASITKPSVMAALARCRGTRPTSAAPRSTSWPRPRSATRSGARFPLRIPPRRAGRWPAIATGCGCGMVTGALAGTAVTAGANLTFVQPSTILHWTGLAMVAFGLMWLGGWRAAVWVPIGGLAIEYGPKLLKLTGDWTVSGVALRFIPAYLLTLAGSGLIMYGFAVAHRRAAVRVSEPASWRSQLGTPTADAM